MKCLCGRIPERKLGESFLSLNPIVQWEAVLTRTVWRWTQEVDESLQECFESTDCRIHQIL